MTLYEKAKKLGLTHKDRWSEGIEHHPKSEELMRFIADHDFHDYEDYFCWKIGGDGDNGETLMYMMDAYFELMDILESVRSPESDLPDNPNAMTLKPGDLGPLPLDSYIVKPIPPVCRFCGNMTRATWNNGILGPGYAEGSYVCTVCGRMQT